MAVKKAAVAAVARRGGTMDKTRRVAQACDACKLRKVKCNGQERCQQCSHLDLKCIYSAVRAQRRTSQKRGRLISEYKKSTAAAAGSFPASQKPTFDAVSLRQNSPPSAALAATTVTSPTAPIPSNCHKRGNRSTASIDGIINSQNNKHNNETQNGTADSSYSPPLSSTPTCNQDFFLALIPAYVSVVYPLNPVISEVELRESIANMSQDREHAALAYAAAAVTVNLTRSGSSRCTTDISSDISNQIKQLITKSIELAGSLHLDTRLTIRRIMIPMFLHNCLMALQKIDLAFFYLREALSMMQMMRVGSAEMLAKSQFDLPERARRERLYWLAFVHERFLSIVDYRPAILTPLSELPEHDPNISDGMHEGFNQIIKLFRLVDGDFLHNWLGSHSDSGLTTAWIEQKQKELDDDDDYLLLGNNSVGVVDEADNGIAISSDAEAGTISGGGRVLQSPGTTRLTDMQQADLIITRQWLRTVVWQMAMSRCLLSSGASKECMSLLFPVRLSHQLRFLITSMSRDAIEIHGSGILKKLFELADTIADVIIHVPIASHEETTARVDDFLFLIRFLFTFPRFDPFEKEILREKLKRLQALFPYIQDQDYERDKSQHSDQSQGQKRSQNHNHNLGSATINDSGSIIHHQDQRSPGSIDGTASTVTVIGTDSTTNAHSNPIMNVPAQAPLPSPLLSLATTVQRSQQRSQQQYSYQQNHQHRSPISASATPVSAETSPNMHSNPNPKPYPNPWLGMTRTVLYNRTDPSFIVNLAPSPPPSSNSAASLALSSPTLSPGGVPLAHAQAKSKSEPVPVSVPASAAHDVVDMTRAHSQTQSEVQTKLQSESDSQAQGKLGGISTSPPSTGHGAEQELINAKWQNMTRRLSMAR